MFATQKTLRMIPVIVLLTMMFICLPFVALAENKTIDTNKVKGKYTNLDWSFLKIEPDIDFSWDDWIPTVKFSILIRVGGTGNYLSV